MSNEFDDASFLDNLISLKGRRSELSSELTPGAPVHQGLGCAVHANKMIPVAGAIWLAADIYTPKLECRYPAVARRTSRETRFNTEPRATSRFLK